MNNDWVKDYLMHHGVLGQKWGVRRYQNKDGSLTPRGRKRYYDEHGELTEKGKKFYRDPDDELNYEGRRALNIAKGDAYRQVREGDVKGAAQSYKDIGALQGKYFSTAGQQVLKDLETRSMSRNNSFKDVADYVADDYSTVSMILSEKKHMEEANKLLDVYKKVYDSLEDDYSKFSNSEHAKPIGDEERATIKRIKALDDAAAKMYADMESKVSEYERTHSKEALAPKKEESLRKAREQNVVNDDFWEGVVAPGIDMDWTHEQFLKEYEKYYDMGGMAYFKDLYKRV